MLVNREWIQCVVWSSGTETFLKIIAHNIKYAITFLPLLFLAGERNPNGNDASAPRGVVFDVRPEQSTDRRVPETRNPDWTYSQQTG